MPPYNPASTRVKEPTSGLDVSGVVTLVFPDGSVTNLGRGAVLITFSTAPAPTITPDRKTLTGTQDGVNDTFTIPGTDSWTTVWVLRNGQFIDTSTYSAGGTGNRTITMTMANLPNDPGSNPELLEVIGFH